MMNRSVLIGVVAGVGIAIAGGVAGFSQLDRSGNADEQTGAQVDTAPVDEIQATAQPQPQSQPRQAESPAVAAAPSQPQSAAPAERCWEEEVEVPAEPRDDKAIAGTAAGALIGGAIADKIGDDNKLATAAGAAAGALIGRRAQREFQENRTTTTTVTRCEPL